MHEPIEIPRKCLNWGLVALPGPSEILLGVETAQRFN